MLRPGFFNEKLILSGYHPLLNSRINATFTTPFTRMGCFQIPSRPSGQTAFRLACIPRTIRIALLISLTAWLSTSTSMGATIQSNGTGGGNWNLGTSWSGGSVPLAGDDVIIMPGDQINATTSQSCTNLEIRGVLNFGTNSVTISASGNLTFSGTGSTTGNNATRSLNVTGNLLVLTGADGAVSGINLSINGISNFQGRLDFNNTNGSKTFNGVVTIADGGTIDFSAGVSLILLSDLVMSGNSVLGGTGAGTGLVVGVSSFTVNPGASASLGTWGCRCSHDW